MAETERTGSPALGRQRSAASGSVLLHSRSNSSSSGSSFNSLRRGQNYAARAAAARLAQVMQANRDLSSDEEDEDDMPYFGSSYLSGVVGDSRREQPLRPTRLNDTPRTISDRSVLQSTVNPRSFSRSSTASVGPQPILQRPKPAVPAALRPADSAPLGVSVDPFRKYAPPDTTSVRGSHETVGHDSRRDSAALLDEIDMLQEDNETLFDKLRLAEEKLAEKEFRTRELEKQITAKEEAVAASAAAREVENEVKALRMMTHRMVLTKEEMEEVVLKRCWLARYWVLAAKHGIHPEVSSGKADFWSSLAPVSLEMVLSAGQRAREEPSSLVQNSTASNSIKGKTRDVNDITGEGNIESMLAVEKGLRELAALKVEDAVMLALARHRYGSDAPRTPGPFDLSPQEVEDVQFKQAWLVYFWRRAKTNGLEIARAEDCIQLWISRSMLQTSVRDQVDVERGLMELRALGIEERLWNVSRREIGKDAANQRVDVLEVLQGSNTLPRTLSSQLIM